jgi:hypothetical protein
MNRELEVEARADVALMSVADGSKYETVSHLAPKALYELASSAALRPERSSAPPTTSASSGPGADGRPRQDRRRRQSLQRVVAAASQLRGHLVAISYSRSREIDGPHRPRNLLCEM